MTKDILKIKGADALLVRNICKVRINKRGKDSNLVTIKSVIFGNYKSDIANISRNFITSKGSKLKCSRMRREVDYIAFENINEECKIIVTNDKVYLLVKDKIVEMDKEICKKIVKIIDTRESIKEKLLGKDLSKSNNCREKETIQQKVRIEMEQISNGGKNENNLTLEDDNVSITHLICDKNNNITGYIVSTSKGEKKSISTIKAIQMAKEKRISNAVVSKVNGKEKLRGYAVKLENLPRIYR